VITGNEDKDQIDIYYKSHYHNSEIGSKGQIDMGFSTDTDTS
jgi:hypothetical protein